MPLPAPIVAILAAAAAAQVSPSTPITVTGRAWAPFISPMGEPFRARTAADDTLANWFRQADRNHDGLLTIDEMQADADRFFAKLDEDHDGNIDPDEIARYERDIAPDIQVTSKTMNPPGVAPAANVEENSGHRSRRERWRSVEDDGALLGIGGRLQGAGRYGLLNMPEPVAAADTNFDRAVTATEFRQAAASRFGLLDRTQTGTLSLSGLQALRPPPPKSGHHPKLDDRVPDARVGNPLPPEK
jgi:Ca2+-binding EF-hand superfamily protein